jgi:hypothetical protein
MPNKKEVVEKVSDQISWWIGERVKKFKAHGHDSMSINPMLAPLIYRMHKFREFPELAEFLINAHLATGYATGFGKLVDEKILPKVFGTTKLNKKFREKYPFSLAAFDEIDHILQSTPDRPAKLLSVKASKWTIQLSMAVQLNHAFSELNQLQIDNKLGDFEFESIELCVYYGNQEDLTDKFDIARGINRGANHDVKDLSDVVHIKAGKDFWAFINNGEEKTQEWVLEGINLGLEKSDSAVNGLKMMIEGYKQSFAKELEGCVEEGSQVDWVKLITRVNS